METQHAPVHSRRNRSIYDTPIYFELPGDKSPSFLEPFFTTGGGMFFDAHW